MPRSVGKVVKMAEQEIGLPFHWQDLRTPISPDLSDVTPLTSKQGKVEYHRFEKIARNDQLVVLSNLFFFVTDAATK